VWRELGIVYRRDRTLPRSASAFITLVRQGVGGVATNGDGDGAGRLAHRR
jgi:hypothetical protein